MIIINNSSMIPIYEQIVNQEKQNIVDGKLKGKGSFVLGVNPGLVHEQRVVEIQKDLEKILDKAKSYDLSKDEIRDLFEILMEE